MRATKLLILAVCLASCAWPNVRVPSTAPPDSQLKAEAFLDAIDTLARKNAPASKRQDILDLTYICRQNAHREALEHDPHARYLAEAIKDSVNGDWDGAIANLGHHSQPLPMIPPPPPGVMSWPDVSCGLMSARDYLETIIALAEAAGAENKCAVACKAHAEACLGHSLGDWGQHCGQVVRAFDAASDGDWLACSEELNHPGG